MRNDDRLLVTHVGSLPRSPELMFFLTARDRKQDYDEDAKLASERLWS